MRLAPQLGVMVVAVFAYFLARGATEASTSDAMRNARQLVRLERALGIYREPAWQMAALTTSLLRTALNSIYVWGHWPVIVVTLLWLARRHPAVYLRARDTMLWSGAIGLVVFVSFPVAPPRLADLGMTDTVTAGMGAYRVLQPTLFTNQYAAMPSLHVGWDLVVGLAIVAATRSVALRVLAAAMPGAMVAAVLLTANHYVLDAVAGAALTTLCWLAVGWRTHRRTARPAPVAEAPARRLRALPPLGGPLIVAAPGSSEDRPVRTRARVGSGPGSRFEVMRGTERTAVERGDAAVR